MKEQELINLNINGVKNITIARLLTNEETSSLYHECVDIIADSANKGLVSTDTGIWDIPNYSYDAKQNVITIFQLKGFEVSSFGGRISWGSIKTVNSDY